MDLLAGAAIAAAFELLPEEQLVPEETESESDGSTSRDGSANTLRYTSFALPKIDLEPRDVTVELTQADEEVDFVPAWRVITSTQLSAPFVDSFFANNQFVDASPIRQLAQPSRPAVSSSSFSSPISQLGAGVGAGSGKGYNVTGAELPQANVGSAPITGSSISAWMRAEGEGGASSTGSASASASASANASATASCDPISAPDLSSLPTVDEGEYFTVTLGGVGDYLDVDWGEMGGATPYMVGEVAGMTYGDGDPTDYTVTATVYDYCGNSATSTGTITVNNVAPDAEPDEIEVSESDMETVIDVLGNDSDQGWYDTLSINSASVVGTIGLVNFDTAGNLTYDPNGQFNHLNDGETATDTFTYTVQDDDGGQSTATVTVTINGIGELPYQLSVMVTDGEMNEEGQDTAKVTFSLDRPAESAFDLSLLVVSNPTPPNAATAADLEPFTGSPVSFGVTVHGIRRVAERGR